MDIDIDTQSEFCPTSIFDVTQASMVKDGNLVKHPVGVYFQNIPVDHITNFAAIPYKEAEECGYFKVDFLHLSVLDYFESKTEITALLKVDPDWRILEDESSVRKLFHIHNHFDIVNRVQPKSVNDLADTLALIRPAKRLLLDAYIKQPQINRKFLYTKPDDGKYYFKKSHAIAYSLTIVLQMHLIAGGVI